MISRVKKNLLFVTRGQIGFAGAYILAYIVRFKWDWIVKIFDV